MSQSDLTFATLGLADLLRHIQTTISAPSSHRPAYALVVGSGLSYGVIPTATEMIDDIVWWLHCQEHSLPFEGLPDKTSKHFDPFCKYRLDRWKQVTARHHVQAVQLDASGVPDRASPDNISDAYQTLMSGHNHLGLYTPDLRRRYMRGVMTRAGSRLNGAHVYLAELLAAQQRPEWQGPPFCRTIFTTNFDPLLQRALQLVNVLYFMSDRPETIEPPDDEHDAAIHLIYTHGSVHRYRLLNTPSEIGSGARANADKLAGYLRSHGVIVAGYSGWSDATFQAMRNCVQFEGNLYWCDRHPIASMADANQSLRSDVIAFLSEEPGNRFYVHTPDGADTLMASIYHELTEGRFPSFIHDPIRISRQQLESINLSGVQLPQEKTEPHVSVTAKLRYTIHRLSNLEEEFHRVPDFAESVPTNPLVVLNAALDASVSLDHRKVIDLTNRALALDLLADDEASARFMRQRAHWELGRFNEMVEDMDWLLRYAPRSEDISTEIVLANRATLRVMLGNPAEALDDVNAALTGMPSQHRSIGLCIRAHCFRLTGDPQAASRDLEEAESLPQSELTAVGLLSIRAQVLLDMSKHAAAREHIEACLVESKKLFPPSNWRLAKILDIKAQIESASGAIEQACATWAHSLKIMRQNEYEEDHVLMSPVLEAVRRNCKSDNGPQ